ncbi:MAG: uroporphyrinogen decarboxylase family protein [Methanomassiliicoccaceae archaeon]|nr:uroporphyrinogen decarboxylase family protein [Methanomassiliicoccaceae archaeon]
MITPKELVISALNMEEVDRIPFCPPFQGYWALGLAGVSVIDSINDPKAAAGAQFDIIESCSLDAVEAMWDWLLPAEAMGCEVKIPEHGTIPTLTHIVNSPGDLDKLELPKIKDFYRFASAEKTARMIAQRTGKERFLMATILSPFTLAGELRGIEQMMMDSIIEESFVHELVNEALNVVTEFTENILEWDTDAVIVCDPTASGDLISAEDYAKFSGDSMKRLGGIIRKGGKTHINHICGNTGDRLETVAGTGCKAFSADTQVNIRDAVEQMRGRMAVIGNLDPTKVLYCGTPDNVRTATKELMEKGGNRGYLFGFGCDIPVGTKLENVIAAADALNGRG